ncbi:MAG: TetR/AcrR family transcriptional regulator [Clostridia bacterium]|nr:TetR/AcrR family transcriptional regulator [Clostridia bacterium]
MPPKAKFTKEEIVSAALEIVKCEGIDALTARSLGSALGSSARPVFTVFENMDEVHCEVINAAKKLYAKYEDEGMNGENAFKGSGTGYIRFATEQPKLFQLLFMREKENVPALNNVLFEVDDYSEKIINSVTSAFGFSRETSIEIYMHLWIYTHGIAVLIATNVCRFTEDEISYMLSEVCGSIVKKFREEGRK